MAEEDLPINAQNSVTAKSESFGSDLKRLVRRGAISRGLSADKNLRSVKEGVRIFEDNSDSKNLIDRLGTEVVVVDPAVEEIAIKASEILRKRNSNISAVVLLGSAIHGGSTVRRITGGQDYEPHDFDWGLITKQPMDRRSAEHVVEDFSDIGEQLGETIHSCNYVNPANYRAVDLGSRTRTLEEIFSMQYRERKPIDWPSFPDYGLLILYFEPSYPLEVNEKNQEVVLKALSSLHNQDEEKWALVVDYMIASWGRAHYIKDKHIQPKLNYKDAMLARRIVDNSGDVMSEPFAQKLLATRAT